jgi:hypothetical protein
MLCVAQDRVWTNPRANRGRGCSPKGSAESFSAAFSYDGIISPTVYPRSYPFKLLLMRAAARVESPLSPLNCHSR